ncbi:hypothetical protein R69927_01786 [Paraburkholderia domus]|jgi:hypothetical protein|uniref:Uncharacterized protein n=1 Tax=Paraburkholderia domus TaxID=2793075 RepID=A0A9N8MYL1_9BURK|nr:hypothetical protein R70006_02097 [Paraburkholderia domus]CAE6759403.1 hypothetical protein R69749_00712 [Paraburkholderia domus]CAE6817671.1 hypothetical protein R75483_06097 [Paraburkholderia domus]CAE6845262.1 hypothetical protein R69927_01786 [Paraburkholderia domus]CAE6892259.1 hypothetical protein R70199_03191 [Paraburkholderia domus]
MQVMTGTVSLSAGKNDECTFVRQPPGILGMPGDSSNFAVLSGGAVLLLRLFASDVAAAGC